MEMAAKVEFHSGSDEVKEHLHSLDPLFFLLPLVRKYETEPSDTTIQQLCELSFWSKQTNRVTD